MLYCTEIDAHNELDGIGAGVRDKEWDNGWVFFVRVENLDKMCYNDFIIKKI